MSKKERVSGPRTRGRIRVRFGKETLDRTAFTMNVSETGAFIRTNQVFPPGATIKVEFNFPDGSEAPLTLFAKVIWAKKVPPQMAHLLLCGMGVRLLDPGPEWDRLFRVWQDGR